MSGTNPPATKVLKGLVTESKVKDVSISFNERGLLKRLYLAAGRSNAMILI